MRYGQAAREWPGSELAKRLQVSWSLLAKHLLARPAPA
jgi:hypothetical protein